MLLLNDSKLSVISPKISFIDDISSGETLSFNILLCIDKRSALLSFNIDVSSDFISFILELLNFISSEILSDFWLIILIPSLEELIISVLTKSSFESWLTIDSFKSVINFFMLGISFNDDSFVDIAEFSWFKITKAEFVLDFICEILSLYSSLFSAIFPRDSWFLFTFSKSVLIVWEFVSVMFTKESIWWYFLFNSSKIIWISISLVDKFKLLSFIKFSTLLISFIDVSSFIFFFISSILKFWLFILSFSRLMILLIFSKSDEFELSINICFKLDNSSDWDENLLERSLRAVCGLLSFTKSVKFDRDSFWVEILLVISSSKYLVLLSSIYFSNREIDSDCIVILFNILFKISFILL